MCRKSRLERDTDRNVLEILNRPERSKLMAKRTREYDRLYAIAIVAT